MKKLFKNKTTIAVTVGALVLIVIMTVGIALAVKHGDERIEKTQTDTTSGTTMIPDIPDPTYIENTTEPTETTQEVIENDGTGLTPGEGETQPTEEKETIPAEPAADPEEKEEYVYIEPEEHDEGVIIIGEDTDPYDCGDERHNCDGPETHAYIQNLENNGCVYCGAHNCDSFYATDEWGNTCYDPAECPKYSIQKDPSEYCSECGKQYGDGSGDTCQRWIVDMCCPVCGKLVSANTCHTHK